MRNASLLSLVVLLYGMSVSRAVILYNSADRNTAMPGSLSNRGTDSGPNGGGDPRDLLNSGWQYEGTYDTGNGHFLGTPIAPNYFITAAHVGAGPSFLYHGTTYSVDSSKQISNTDLQIFHVTGTFDSYAPLWNASTDGNEVGQKLVVIGRGTQRGSEVRQNGTLRGWQWGADDHVQSWGTNTVSAIVDASQQNLGQLLTFNFDATGGANEGGLSAGDSGGAVFLQSGDTWKLAGINYGVDSPWSLTDGGSVFNADLFDYRGVYFYDASTGKYQLQGLGNTDRPGASYASLISANLTDIDSAIGLGATATPEPTSCVTACLAAVGFAVVKARRNSLWLLEQR